MMRPIARQAPSLASSRPPLCEGIIKRGKLRRYVKASRVMASVYRSMNTPQAASWSGCS